MDKYKVIEALKVLEWFSNQAADLPDDRENGLRTAARIGMARCYLFAYASHLDKGDEPYDAMLKAARGELELDKSGSLDLFFAMAAEVAADEAVDKLPTPDAPSEERSTEPRPSAWYKFWQKRKRTL